MQVQKRLCRGGKPLAFLYVPSEILLEDWLFLITSDRELRRNRHDIYESNMNNKQ
jgi:nitroreductase